MQRATAAELFGDGEFVRLTTFKRDGTPVPTTVWCAPDGDDLVVTTQDTTGKVKRIRHTPLVLLAPSSRTGKVEDGAVDVEASASLFDDLAGLERLARLIGEKYGLVGKAFVALTKRGKRDRHRIGIRIRV